MAPPARLARSLGLGADPPGRAPPAGPRRPGVLPRAARGPRHPARRLAAGDRHGGVESRWRAACGPSGKCAPWAWDAAGTVRATCASSVADAGPCDTQVKFAKRVRGLSPAQSPRLALLPRLGGSRKSLRSGGGLREILALRYLTKVEKTHQVERVAAAGGGHAGAPSVPACVASGRGG